MEILVWWRTSFTTTKLNFGPFSHCCIHDMVCSAGLEQRTVQDRSYHIGLLLSKTQELNGEISRMTKEIDTFEQDNATYLTYEKK